MFLQVIGGIALVLLVLLVFIILFIRFKWKKIVGSIDEAVKTPSEIHLMEDINPDWIDEAAIKELQAENFTLGKAYTISEIPSIQLVSIFHTSSQIVGAYYFQEKAGNWYDLVAGTEDEEITLSNAPLGEELNQRSGAKKIWKKKASLNELLQDILSITKDSKITKEITPETFREEVEKAYARDMAWRNSQGGVTEDEIRRVAENMDGEFNDETILDSLEEAKSKELYQWHDEIMKKLSHSSEFEEKYEDSYFYVSDQVEITLFLEYLTTYINLTEKQEDNFTALITDTMNVTELFDRIVECMSPGVRPKLIQPIDSPVQGNIYLARDMPF